MVRCAARADWLRVEMKILFEKTRCGKLRSTAQVHRHCDHTPPPTPPHRRVYQLGTSRPWLFVGDNNIDNTGEARPQPLVALSVELVLCALTTSSPVPRLTANFHLAAERSNMAERSSLLVVVFCLYFVHVTMVDASRKDTKLKPKDRAVNPASKYNLLLSWFVQYY